LRYAFSKITHRIGKKLTESSRTYAVKRQFCAGILSFLYLPATEIDSILKKNAYKFQAKYGIELAASSWIVPVKAVENLVKF
jgi:hypothetical protein